MIQKIDTSKLTSDDNSSVDDSADDSDMSYSSDSSSGGNAFITILSTGAYRIKGTVNEMNVQNIIEEIRLLSVPVWTAVRHGRELWGQLIVKVLPAATVVQVLE